MIFGANVLDFGAFGVHLPADLRQQDLNGGNPTNVFNTPIKSWVNKRGDGQFSANQACPI
jgi:hypothetical protein